MTQQLRILYIHHGSGRAGAANSLARLLEGLDRRRFEPVVACGFHEPTARAFFEKQECSPLRMSIARFSHVASWWPLCAPRGLAKTVQWALIKQPRSIRGLQTVMRRVQPDIVHLNSLTLAPLMPAIRRNAVPVVLHVREPVAKGMIGLRRQWLRRLARHQADRIVYICKDNRDRLTGPMPHARVFYNPIPFDKFDKSLAAGPIRRDLGIPENTSVLFFPGGSNLGIKGIFPFLAALTEIRRHESGCYAIVPGVDDSLETGSVEQRRVRATIDSLGIRDAVRTPPFTEAVEQYYAAADVVVAPFTTAHFSMAVLEAGAMEKPVVGSRLGGIDEVLKDGENGLQVRPGDARMLANKVMEVMRDPDGARNMGRRGLRQTMQLCNAERYAERMAELYLELRGCSRERA